jgi:hypothetical protein
MTHVVSYRSVFVGVRIVTVSYRSVFVGVRVQSQLVTGLFLWGSAFSHRADIWDL